MLSYQHGFHAGNFADVHKHAVLTLVLTYLKQKSKPISYLDVFAGRGRYYFSSSQAQKTQEYENGIEMLWEQPWPESLRGFRQALEMINPSGLKAYPGSPELAALLCAPDDSLTLCELHPKEHEALTRNMADYDNAAVHKVNAFEALKAMVPPMPRRGAILLDPSYERKIEYREVAESVESGHKKWATGCWLVWYPILAEERHRELLNKIAKIDARSILLSEVRLNEVSEGMVGTGMLVLNGPWNLRDQVHGVGQWLSGLGPAGAKVESRWIKAPE